MNSARLEEDASALLAVVPLEPAVDAVPEPPAVDEPIMPVEDAAPVDEALPVEEACAAEEAPAAEDAPALEDAVMVDVAAEADVPWEVAWLPGVLNADEPPAVLEPDPAPEDAEEAPPDEELELLVVESVPVEVQATREARRNADAWMRVMRGNVPTNSARAQRRMPQAGAQTRSARRGEGGNAP